MAAAHERSIASSNQIQLMTSLVTPDELRELESPERLAELAASGLMDSPSEETFDRLTRLASRVLSVPVALVSLVDDNRQFFKSSCGLGEPWCSDRETPLTHSFCKHVVGSAAPLVVQDARLHPVLKTNLAIPDLGVIAYAGFPLRTPSGNVLGSFCAIDVVPRIWTEEELANLRDLTESAATEISLRREIAKRKEAQELLILARDEALHASKAKSDFLTSMSHELRTPLNSIIGFSEILQDSEEVQSLPKHSRYLGNVVRSAKHLLELIDELLDHSRIEAGKLEFTIEKAALSPLLKSVVTQFIPAAEKKNLAIELVPVPPEAQVLCDPTRLRQILLNLLSNSVKFTDEGGVKIWMETTPGFASIFVKDTGPGLATDEEQRIFTPFERLSATAQGTGLGLSISRSLATAMSGSLTVTSAGHGHGSTFKVVLPLADSP
jgi:signal transduction histidine kinase